MNGICHHCRRDINACVLRPCSLRHALNEEDRRGEAFDTGYKMFRRGEPRPTGCADTRAGWDAARSASMTRVVMVPRPEGYYHVDPRGEA